MNHTRRLSTAVPFGMLLALLIGSGSSAGAQTGTFQAGTREIFSLDLAGTPAGGLRKGIRLLTGAPQFVDKDGVRMLKSVAPVEFLIQLTEKLPERFTLEFDVISRNGNIGGPEFAFEGTPALSRSPRSGQVAWSHQGLAIYGGGIDREFKLPEGMGAELMGQLAEIRVAFEGAGSKLLTNGEVLYDLPNLPFPRGRVLRVFMHGVDDTGGAFYLAKLRIAEGGGITAGAVAQQPAPTPIAVVQVAPTTGTITATAVTTIAQPTASITPAPAQPAPAETPASRTFEITRIQTTTALAPPTSLTAAGTPAMATLTWQAPMGWTPTGYTVVRNTVGTSESESLTSSPITTTRYDDRSGFTAGKTYAYVVTALSTDLKAFGTAQTEFLPPPPQNVSNVVAKPNGSDVAISWTGVPDATKYFIAASSEAMAREVPGTQTLITYSGVAPGTYTWAVGARYEPGPIETPASTWPSVTIVVTAPRTITLSGFTAAGGFTNLAPRTITLSSFTAAGGFTSVAPRTITLSGFTAAGGSTIVAPPIITLSGFTAAGGFFSIAPRTITLSGFTAAGSFFATLAPRTITLSGWTAVGPTPTP